MYSLVLATYLGLGTTTPQFGWSIGHCGRPSGAAAGAACAGSSTTCQGRGGGFFNFFNRSNRNGCQGAAAPACQGSCAGSYAMPSCTAFAMPACAMPACGGYGSAFACSGMAVSSYATCGGYAAMSCMAPSGCFGINPMPQFQGGLPPAGLSEQLQTAPGANPPGIGWNGTPSTPGMTADGTPPPPTAANDNRNSTNQATFVITLPADARLAIDGQGLPLTGPVRVFNTPALDPSREYFYDVTIEVERNGRTLRDQQSVRFKAGKVARVDFSEPKADSPEPKSSKSARIHVRAPFNSAITVEGKPWSIPENGSVIVTPPLTPGQVHYYVVKAEVVIDGQKLVKAREVAFQAGQDVTIELVPELSTEGIARR